MQKVFVDIGLVPLVKLRSCLTAFGAPGFGLPATWRTGNTLVFGNLARTSCC